MIGDIDQRKYWEKHRKRRAPTHKVIEAFAKPKIDYIMSVISESINDLSVLDVGCGNGFFTYYLEKLVDTTGLDFSESMLSMNPCPKKVCGSATDLPFGDNSFDVVFCSNLLHHIKNPSIAVSEMKRVSKHYVIVSEPNRNNPLMFLFGLMKKTERGTLKMSLNYLKKLISQVNLSIISAATMGAVLPNKTPKAILPVVKVLDGEYPLSFYWVVVAQK